jgi:hypothetical protein
MIHYIRDKKGKTLLDLEVFQYEGESPDLSSTVIVEPYSRFLLDQDTIHKKETAIFVFDRLSEARGWYWETYRETINKNPSKEDVEGVIGEMVKGGAEALGLSYVTD